MPRAIWKGSISFGLVNAPVAGYAAISERNLDRDFEAARAEGYHAITVLDFVPLKGPTLEELRRQAAKAGIEGRSKMGRAELERALEAA